MSISSVSSSGSAHTHVARSQPDAKETKAAGGKTDGDPDDTGSIGGVPKITSPKPVLNTHGHTIGKTINVKA